MEIWKEMCGHTLSHSFGGGGFVRGRSVGVVDAKGMKQSPSLTFLSPVSLCLRQNSGPALQQNSQQHSSSILKYSGDKLINCHRTI